MKKVAIIGYGGQGAWHARQIGKSDVVLLSGIYDISKAAINRAISKGVRVYKSIEETFNDDTVDIVVVATTNDAHKELVIKALESGKNVICEKPAEMSVKALDLMIAAAKKSGKLFSVHQNRRFDADFIGIKSIIDSGEIGELLHIESRVHGSRGIPSDWRCHKECGGGMIFDWGVHLIDQIMQIITEKVVAVFCYTTHIVNSEVDDGFKLTLFFESGKTAYIEVGTYNFISMPRFYLQCKGGSAVINNWQNPAHVAKLIAWNEKDVSPVQTAAGITKTMAPRDSLTLDEYDAPYPKADVHDYYRNFVSAIDGNCESMVKLSEVRRVTSVMEAAFLSDSKKAIIEVSI